MITPPVSTATPGSTSNLLVKGPNWSVVQAMWTHRDAWKARQAAQHQQQRSLKMRKSKRQPNSKVVNHEQ